MNGVPCVKPWDAKFGEAFDVLTNGAIILNLIACGRLIACHFGLPCKSFTWARWPQLRDSEYPLGLPFLGAKQQRMVDLGNRLLAFTMECCKCLHLAKAYFSVENPELSWAWVTNVVQALLKSEDVKLVRFMFRDFNVPFYKPTVILHNTPTLHMLSVPVATWPGRCIPLRGLAIWEGQLQFRTQIAEPYPPAFGVRFGELMLEAILLRKAALQASLPVPFAGGSEGFRLGPSIRQAVMEYHEFENDDEAHELVVNGLGAIKGLGHLEHVEWTKGLSHPSSQPPEAASKELWAAIQFEASHTPEEIDDFRSKKLAEIIHKAKTMQQSQASWASLAAKENHSVVSQIHGPLFGWCLRMACGGEQLFEQFLLDLLVGFPLVGDLAPCEGSGRQGLPKSFPKTELTEEGLRQNRVAFNQQVLDAIKPLPYSEDILPATQTDFEKGFMTRPRRMASHDKKRGNITRRIPVREERASGWRTRIVDHETESLINEATRPCDKVRHDGIDVLALIATLFMFHGIVPELWKRDISSAFRRVPILAAHLEFAFVAWWHDNEVWISQHLGMPFGTVSAVYAWHRVGHALLFLVMVLCKAPMGRYVDDYFGACRQGVTYTGGVCLTIIATLLGFPTDDAKDADNMMRMTVLGAMVIVDFPAKAVLTHVSESKAEKWKTILLALLESGVCTSQEAASMGGRLSFSVTTSANRVGRAFIKPFYAQQMAPMHGNLISASLAWAIEWFIVYLTKLPVAIKRGIQPRPLVVTWHDAAGESRWVAAVVRVDTIYFWTRLRTPDHIWAQLAPREDSQIGFQELLGFVLLLGTFEHLLSGSLWLSFGDNDGVTYSVAKGGGHSEESNMTIGKVWMAVASIDADLHVARVESAANIADGPTREDLSKLEQLGASFVEPCLPHWIHDVWHSDSV